MDGIDSCVRNEEIMRKRELELGLESVKGFNGCQRVQSKGLKVPAVDKLLNRDAQHGGKYPPDIQISAVIN